MTGDEGKPARFEGIGYGDLEVTGSGDGKAVQLDISTGDGEGATIVLAAASLDALVAALYEQAGRVPPVMLGRPEVIRGRTSEVGPFRLWLARGPFVVIKDGTYSTTINAGLARLVGAAICAHADAAEAPEPRPADVERMASLFTEASRMAPDDAARYLLRRGVTLPGGDGGNG